MYHAHWGLARSPFASGGTPLFFEGESQAESLARLRYVAQYRRHAVLLGARGVGKSQLARHFAEVQRREGRIVVSACLTGLNSRELLWQTAAGLMIAPRPDDDVVKLFRRLADYASAAQWLSNGVTMLLDDADQAGADVGACLMRLLTLNSSAPWLTLMMVAGPQSVRRLGAELLDAVDLRIDVEPWSEADTIGYIQHALVEAGAERPVFEDEALGALYALTDGMPRQVNRLADHAMLGAAADGQEMVDAAMVEAAHDALGWAASGAA
jgi:type II secretory pathway predicted ATPase ExeA